MNGNPVGSEYIIMEKVDGVELSQKWPLLKGKERLAVMQSLLKFEEAFASVSFQRFGSLYYKDDIPEFVHSESCLRGYAGDANIERFAIGPTTDRRYCESGRERVYVDKSRCVSRVPEALC